MQKHIKWLIVLGVLLAFTAAGVGAYIVFSAPGVS